MNDFTKDELKDIEYICGQYLSTLGHGDNPCDYIDLQEKIQGMIDNYCEHDWDLFLSPYGNIGICSKCNQGMRGEL